MCEPNRNIEITQKSERLFSLLFTKDFDSKKLLIELKSGTYSVDDINIAAFRYIDICGGVMNYNEYGTYSPGEHIPNIESSHLVEAIKILANYGLDPNYTFGDSLCENILSALRHVHNGYQAADAAAILLEFGANPNLVVDGEHLYADVDLDISWFLGGDIESRYIADTFMHYWMVLVGYGAKWEDGSEIIKPYNNFNAVKFRNHRRYYYGIVHGEGTSHSWISFFDKETNREVARR